MCGFFLIIFDKDIHLLDSLTQIFVEILNTTGTLKSKGTIVTFTTVASVPGGILMGLSGVEVNLAGVVATIAAGVVAPIASEGKAVVVCKRHDNHFQKIT